MTGSVASPTMLCVVMGGRLVDACAYTHLEKKEQVEKSTEMRFNLCTWLGVDSSCSCLTVLPGPAGVLLNKICKD